jgi:hypothetical protein
VLDFHIILIISRNFKLIGSLFHVISTQAVLDLCEGTDMAVGGEDGLGLKVFTPQELAPLLENAPWMDSITDLYMDWLKKLKAIVDTKLDK